MTISYCVLIIDQSWLSEAAKKMLSTKLVPIAIYEPLVTDERASCTFYSTLPS